MSLPVLTSTIQNIQNLSAQNFTSMVFADEYLIYMFIIDLNIFFIFVI